MGCGSIDGLVEVESAKGVKGGGYRFTPVVLLTGSENLCFSIAGLLDKEYMKKTSADKITAELIFSDSTVLLKCIDPEKWVFSLVAAPDNSGWGDLHLQGISGGQVLLEHAVRVIDKFRITLTFDDGPAVDKKALENTGDISGSPTVKTLEVLDHFRHGVDGKEIGIKAAFFVLTTSDKFIFFTFRKAECENGRKVLAEVARRGHVIGVHWGGRYGKQSLGHDRRVGMPPYPLSIAVEDGFTNALECDIAECMSTIEQVTGQHPEFVRPPFWRFRNKADPEVEKKVFAVYKKFGLKMILTDAKFPDGGYYIISIISINKYRVFPRMLRRAFLSGEDNLVISMHDSNGYTAGSLRYLLQQVKEEFADISFGGFQADAGKRLDFAASAVEVRQNLRNKKRYVLFPYYKAQEKAGCYGRVSAGR